MNIKNKALLYILVPPVIFVGGILLGYMSDAIQAKGFVWGTFLTIAVLMIGLGVFWLIPGFLYGLKLYRFSNKPATSDINTDSGLLNVWVNTSFLSSIFGNSSITRILSKAYAGELSWSNETRTLQLTRTASDNSVQVFSVRYEQIKSVRLNLTYLKFALPDGNYWIFVRSNVSDMAYVGGLLSRTGGVGSIASDYTILNMHGVNDMLDVIEDSGVYVSRPAVLRAVMIGTAISSALYILFILYGVIAVNFL